MVIIPTILCGGSGSRLWPVSREFHPKPFIRLGDGISLLQKAFQRGASINDAQEILVVTNQELFFKTDDEFRQVNSANLPISYILEPAGRNTAAAIAAAALYVANKFGRDAVMLVLAADHLITDQAAFSEAVEQAKHLAQSDRLVTFGIQPDRPEIGYGYIEADGQRVVRFVEKPSLDVAQQYLDSGRYLWNSGIFCFKAGAILAELEQHSPAILQAAKICMDQSRVTEGVSLSQVHLNPESFTAIPENSIDYAVMEKSQRVSVIPCKIGWSDIGSWLELSKITSVDSEGNRLEGETVLHDVHNCFIQSQHRMVAAVGVSDLIIIDTPDAVLIADKSRSQDVKYVYAALKKRGHESYRQHAKVHRPWGTYTVLDEGMNFKIKCIVVKPGSSLSLQMHHHRSEHWVVVQGMAKVVNGDNELLVRVNESTFIRAGFRHRLSNPGLLNLVMIEVQSGEYLGEDDIIRFDDVYGRA